jgi:ABC-type glycerol-3-phosphate transport system substrate-binding protein
MAKIDHSSPLPLYHQLKALIKDQIASGLWRPGDRIPTQEEMCREFNISRSPVRQALNELIQEGTLSSRPGLGTFVSDHTTQLSPSTSIRVMTSNAHFQSEVLPTVSRAYNAAHPDKQIAFQIEFVEHGQFYHQLSQAVGKGAAPDIAMVDCVWVAGLARSGYLYPLEELNSGWNHSEFVGDLYPAFVEANSLNGKLYGLPVTADASLLWYRKDWFEQEGLAPPSTWDDLTRTGRYFLRPEIQRKYKIGFPLALPGGTTAGEATIYTLMPFIWSTGGDVFNRNVAALNTGGTCRALRFLRELVAHHRIAPPEVVNYREDTAPRLFASGKVAMALGGSYEGVLIRDASGWDEAEFLHRVGFVVPPAAPAGAPISTVGGNSYVVLRQCHRSKLAMSVLKKATDPQIISEPLQSLWLNSPTPHTVPGVEAPFSQIAQMIAASRARPSIPEYVRVSYQLQLMFEAVLSATTPIDEIVSRTSDFVRVLTESPFLPARAI